ncbi:hypothetical protein BST61_g9282 [Cercospora zeina]
MAIPSTKILATLSGAFLTGAMMTLSFVAIPALLNTSEATQLLSQWEVLFDRGHKIMPTLAVGTALLHAYNAHHDYHARLPWRACVVAAIVTVGIAPFTWTAMASTNSELVRLGAHASSADLETVKELVYRWNRLHFTRSLLPCLGTVVSGMNAFA